MNQFRKIAAVVVALLAVVSFAFYLELTTPKVETINVYISPQTYTLSQNESLNVSISVMVENRSGPLAIDGSSYMKGLQVIYMGLSPNATTPYGLPSPFQGLIKYSVSQPVNGMIAPWNLTILNPNGTYSLAPAGYYQIQEGANIIHAPAGVSTSVHYHLPSKFIEVKGVYGNISNNTNKMQIAALNFAVTSPQNLRVIISVINDSNSNVLYRQLYVGETPFVEDLPLSNASSFQYTTVVSIETDSGQIFYVEDYGVVI